MLTSCINNNNNSTNTTNSDMNQRRPNRIGASSQTPQISSNFASAISPVAKNGSGGKRLKSSSIAKVPLANSRLRQPVASSSIIINNQTATTAANNSVAIDKKMTIPTIKTIPISQRPTSLPLACNSSAGKRISPSDASQRKSLVGSSSNTNRIIKQTAQQVDSNTTIRRSTTGTTTTTRHAGKLFFLPLRKYYYFSQQSPQFLMPTNLEHPGGTASSLSDDCKQQQQRGRREITANTNETKRETTTTTTANSIQKCGSKNLVAVVHPQHSNQQKQRVNSSATQLASKLKTTTITTATSTSTKPPPLPKEVKSTNYGNANNNNNKQQLMSFVKEAGSGKVNFNHKDVNGCETITVGSGSSGSSGSSSSNGSSNGSSPTNKQNGRATCTGGYKSGRSQLQQMLFGGSQTKIINNVPVGGVGGGGGDQVKNVSTITNQKKVVRVANKCRTNNNNEQQSTMSILTDYDDLDSSDDRQQFSLCNGNNYNYTNENCHQTAAVKTTFISVASKNSNQNHHNVDKDSNFSFLRHDNEKSKQATKTQTLFDSSLGTRSLHVMAAAAAASQKSVVAIPDDESGRLLRDNCYNNNNNLHHRGAKSTLTKSTASIDHDDDDDSNRNGISSKSGEKACTFSHRLLSKPMGQQVLSLMMLDVGLMPSNSTNHIHHQQHQPQQQLHQAQSVSHVRIQSPPGRDSADSSSGRIFDRCSFHQSLKPPHNVALENNPKFRETNIPINEMLCLKLSSNLDSNSRSISLPSSPRLRVRQHYHQQSSAHTKMNERLPYHHEHSHNPTIERLDRNSQTSITDWQQSATNRLLLSPSKYYQQQQQTSSNETQEYPPTKLSASADRYRDDSRSISSSCSSLNHTNYPPLLAISNQLNDLNLQELMLQRRQKDPTIQEAAATANKQNLLVLNTSNSQTNRLNTAATSIPTVVADRNLDKVAVGYKSNCPETGTISSNNNNNNNNYDADDDDDDDGGGGGNSNCFNACSLKSKPSDTDSGYENIGDHSPGATELTTIIPRSVHPDHSRQQLQLQQQQLQPQLQLHNGSYRDSGESCLDPSLRQRQQQQQQQQQQQHQQRSHSLSGQELSFNGNGYQRLNQFITQHVSPELDHHRQRYGMQTPIFQSTQQQQQQQQQQQRTQQMQTARSPSPLSYSGHMDQNRDISSNDIQKPRNHLHASLECLNSSYLDYQHQHLQQQQQQQQHQQQQQQQIRQHQQQMNLHNHHYAAATNYILATPPANTVVNQNGDQDLAAAAMADNNPLTAAAQHQHHHQNQYQHHHLQQSVAPPPTPNNIYAHQSIINRAMAQVHQSPARRYSSAQHGSTGMASTLINNLTNLHHPMRAGHSSLSLSSSSYIIEDKLQNEIKKLHSELKSEKEKNEALNSQLNINSNLMAAFEQSLTTLNSRLRQLTTINERKDQEIEELRMQIELSKLNVGDGGQQREQGSATDHQFINGGSSPANSDSNLLSPEEAKTSSCTISSEKNNNISPDERCDLLKVIENLKRQLIEKDRLLTDTRLEALSAAHQLEQLESRLDKEHRSVVVNEDDLDEGVMVTVNHSPSDSDAVTDSAHFSETNQTSQSGGGGGGCKSYNRDTSVAVRVGFDGNTNIINHQNPNRGSLESSPECNNNHLTNNGIMIDNQSNHSSDYHDHSSDMVRATNDQTTTNNSNNNNNNHLISESNSEQFNESSNNDISPMDRLMDSLLSSAS